MPLTPPTSLFAPVVVSDSREIPGVYFQAANVHNSDEVAGFVESFTSKHGEPTEGYVWQAAPSFIHVYLRKEREEK